MLGTYGRVRQSADRPGRLTALAVLAVVGRARGRRLSGRRAARATLGEKNERNFAPTPAVPIVRASSAEGSMKVAQHAELDPGRLRRPGRQMPARSEQRSGAEPHRVAHDRDSDALVIELPAEVLELLRRRRPVPAHAWP